MLCVFCAINKRYFRKFSVGYCVLSENRDFFMSMFLLLLMLLILTLLLSLSILVGRKCYECKSFCFLVKNTNENEVNTNKANFI